MKNWLPPVSGPAGPFRRPRSKGVGVAHNAASNRGPQSPVRRVSGLGDESRDDSVESLAREEAAFHQREEVDDRRGRQVWPESQDERALGRGDGDHRPFGPQPEPRIFEHQIGRVGGELRGRGTSQGLESVTSCFPDRGVEVCSPPLHLAGSREDLERLDRFEQGQRRLDGVGGGHLGQSRSQGLGGQGAGSRRRLCFGFGERVSHCPFLSVLGDTEL